MSEKEKNINLLRPDKLWPLVLLFLLIFIVWGSSFLVVYYKLNSWTDRGTFGDTFGGINALFSGLAFAGIIYTILLQRKELALQRQELADTRIELKRSADAQEKSEQALNSQIETMKITSKLNALNSLFEAYSAKEEKTRTLNLTESNKAKEKKEMFLSEIENTLKNIEK